MEMMKKIIEKNIVWENQKSDFRWKDIKKALKESNVELDDEDFLYVDFCEDDENSDDSYWVFCVIRKIEETDKEYSERIIREEKSKEESKERRYQSYLKLKKEFE